MMDHFTLYNVQSKLGTFSINEVVKRFYTMQLLIFIYAAETLGYDYSYSIQIDKVHDHLCVQFLYFPGYTYSLLSRVEVGNYYTKVLSGGVLVSLEEVPTLPHERYMPS